MKKLNNTNEKVETLFKDLNSFLPQLPGFIACYLAGSYAYGYYIEGISDLDLTFIFSDSDYGKQKTDIEHMLDNYDVEMDISFFSLTYIAQNKNKNDVRQSVWAAKVADILVCGTDILKEFKLPDAKEYAYRTCLKALDQFKELDETNLTHETEIYEDIPSDLLPFITLRNGKPCIKQMVVACTWVASTYLAMDYGIFTAGKNYTVNEYRKRYTDGECMYELLENCKMNWGYNVPSSVDEINMLRLHCQYLLRKQSDLLRIHSELEVYFSALNESQTNTEV